MLNPVYLTVQVVERLSPAGPDSFEILEFSPISAPWCEGFSTYRTNNKNQSIMQCMTGTAMLKRLNIYINLDIVHHFQVNYNNYNALFKNI